MPLIRVYGKPAPQGSKRHVGRGFMREASKYVAPWREAVVAAVLRLEDAEREMMDFPLRVRTQFLIDRPKSHFRSNGTLKPTAPIVVSRAPDIDKLCRATFDGLTQSGLIADDSLIVDSGEQKLFCNPGEPQGAIILISRWEP